MITTSMLDDMLSEMTVKLDNKIVAVKYSNSDTIEYLTKAYKDCNLYICDKLSMPSPNQSLDIVGNSKKLNKLIEILNDLEGYLEGVNKVIKSETIYKSFRAKVCLWCSTVFKDVLNTDNECSVFVHLDNISKHEWLFLHILYRAGVNITLLCNNITDLDIYDNYVKQYMELKTSGSDDKLDYKCVKSMPSVISEREKYSGLDEVETAFYDNNKLIKLIIVGADNYIDTCNFYGRMYKESESNPDFKLYINGFDKITYEQSMSIPRIRIDKADYIIDTVLKFLNVKEKELKDNIYDIIKRRFNESDLRKLSSQQLFNKIVYCVLTLNNIFNNKVYKCIAFYGNVGNNDKLVLDILGKVNNLSLFVLISDKNKAIHIDDVDTLELSSTLEIFDIPKVDTRSAARTMASTVADRVHQQLFSDNTLGMYKPGMFTDIEVKLFKTTFDETELWWNKEMHIRPQFETNGCLATVPTMFKVIQGIKSTEADYLKYVQKLSCGKTLLCRGLSELNSLSAFTGQTYTMNFNGMFFHRNTDINKTRYTDQKSFIRNNNLIFDKVKNASNYRYGFLSDVKQNLIINKINDILNGNTINRGRYTNEEFIDTVLNTLLNLDTKILQYIQWYEFYTYNPNLIIVLPDEKQLEIHNIILLQFLYSLGFDILIFVPTCYSSIERLVTSNFMYDTHLIGEAYYNMSLNNLYVTDNIEVINHVEKKQGFFNKIFNKEK